MDIEEQNNTVVEQQKPQEDQKVKKQGKLIEGHSKSELNKARIVIRNLVYDINDKLLNKLFSKYGKVLDVNIPVNPSTGKSRGFAFVNYENKNIALKAIKELNGTQYKGRQIILDLAVSKDKYQVNNPVQQKKSKEEEIEQEGADDEGEFEIQQDKQIKKKQQEQESDSESDIGNDENLKEEQEKEVKPKKNFIKEKGQKGEKKGRKEGEPEDLSQTIFVRNISFKTTQKGFEEFFKGFGEYFFAKLVINKETGENKGTGFVKFKDPAVTKKLIEATENFGSELEPVDLDLDGRRLICLQTLQKDEAVQKTSQFEKDSKNKIDPKKAKNIDQLVSVDRQGKRHIRLAKLGTFDVGLGKNDTEKDRRTKHLKEKLEKLKNPNYVVSQTRVAFKHLPKEDFDEENIKKIAFKHLNSMLTSVEIKKQKIIKQVMLLRDSENGNKSKGIGFLEFSEQKYAEHFLKEITNKIDVFRQQCQNQLPIVELAIEDIRKIKKYNKLKETFKEKQKEEEEEKTVEEKKKERQQKKEKIEHIKQNELSAKLQLTQILEQNDKSKETYERALTLLENIKKRGLKQRFRKKITKLFEVESVKKDQKELKKESIQQKQSAKYKLKQQKLELKEKLKEVQQFEKIQEEKQTEINQAEVAKFKEEKKKNKVLGKMKHLKEKEQLDEISKSISKKRKAKQFAQEQDDLDVTVKKHLQKIQKKLKWHN